MKILSKALLCCSLAFYLSACTKSETNEELLSRQDIAAVNAVDSVTAALINKDWKYFEYYTGYNTTAPKLSYKAGKAANALNLQPIIVHYNQNLTYTETTAAGGVQSGTYYLSSNNTVLNVVVNGQTFSSNIRLLNGNTFRWQAIDGGNYGVMMTTLPKTDTSKTLTQMLTANKWKYDMYFTEYVLPAAGIAYGTPTPPNTNYGYGTVTRQFNTNLTYVETSQSGTLSGNWSLNGNVVSVNYANGSFYADTIKILQPGRLEMANGTYIYYRMVPAN